jgi:hypothetical protein
MIVASLQAEAAVIRPREDCETRLLIAVPKSTYGRLELEVRLGRLGRNRLLIMDGEGRPLGVAASFPPGQPSVIVLPVPLSAVREGRLPLLVRVLAPDGSSRPLRPGELLGAEVMTVGDAR